MLVGNTVKKIIAEELRVEPAKVTDAAMLFDDLGADELGRLRVVMALEAELDIEIDDRAIERFCTVGDVVKCVEGLVA